MGMILGGQGWAELGQDWGISRDGVPGLSPQGSSSCVSWRTGQGWLGFLTGKGRSCVTSWIFLFAERFSRYVCRLSLPKVTTTHGDISRVISSSKAAVFRVGLDHSIQHGNQTMALKWDLGHILYFFSSERVFLFPAHLEKRSLMMNAS